MRRAGWVLTMALLVGACSGGGGKTALRSADDATTSTASAVVSGAETVPGGGTTSTLAAVAGSPTTTTAGRPVTTTSTAKPAAQGTAATTVTTGGLAATTTTAGPVTTTTVGQPTTTTTGAPGTTTTTKPLEKVSALTIKGACQPEIPASFAYGIDPPRLRADLAAQGYEMPALQFRQADGQGVQPVVTPDAATTRAKWKNCFDAAGGKKFVVTITTVAGEAGSAPFANLVKGEIDEISGLTPYGSSTVA